MPTIQNIPKLFLLKIQSLYDTEKQLEKALPKLAKTANDPDLKHDLLEHVEQTKEHSVRLERIFAMLEATPKKLKGLGIRAIIADGEWVIHEVDAINPIKDTLIASAARYAEHYEIGGYLTAIAFADTLVMSEASGLLTLTLHEELSADDKLFVAISKNIEASL